MPGSAALLPLEDAGNLLDAIALRHCHGWNDREGGDDRLICIRSPTLIERSEDPMQWRCTRSGNKLLFHF